MIDKRFTDPVGYLRDEAASISDGVALTSAAHPVAPWYRRVWWWLRGSRPSPDSLETIEINIEERRPADGTRDGDGVWRGGLWHPDLLGPRPMGNVTDLPLRPKRPELIWECRCGGQHFYLHNDGTIECRSCKLVNETIEWVFREGQGPRR